MTIHDPRQRPGPVGPDHEAGQAGGARRRGPDLHVRRQGRRRLHHGQRRRPAPHQRRGPPPGGDQRHRPGLPGRILHGRRPLCTAAALSSSTAWSSTPGAASGRSAPPIPAPTSSPWPPAAPSIIRDPYQQVVEEQLNGGEIVPLTAADWDLILPYLQENERLFGISIEQDLLHRGRAPEGPGPGLPQGPAAEAGGPHQDRGVLGVSRIPRQDARKGRPGPGRPFYILILYSFFLLLLFLLFLLEDFGPALQLPPKKDTGRVGETRPVCERRNGYEL